MAQFIPGKTSCSICGKPVASAHEAVVFPAFVPPGHEFSSFSDGVFHHDCFMRWSDRDRFQRLYSAYQRVWKSRPAELTFEEAEAWGKQAFEKLFSEGMVRTD